MFAKQIDERLRFGVGVICCEQGLPEPPMRRVIVPRFRILEWLDGTTGRYSVPIMAKKTSRASDPHTQQNPTPDNTELAKNILGEMAAEGVLKDLLGPTQSGRIEMTFESGTVLCEVGDTGLIPVKKEKR